MRKTFCIVALLVLSFAINSCKDEFLETTPTDSTSEKSAFRTTENATMALNGIYRLYYSRHGTDRVSPSQGRVGLGATYMQIDLLGEDIVFPTLPSGWYTSLHRFLDSRNSYDSDCLYPWWFHYIVISNANAIINNVASSIGSQKDIDNIMGQALVIRAFSYYQMVQLYAKRYVKDENNTQLGLPLVLDNSDGAGKGLPRSSVEEVYTQINKDLDKALTLLDPSGVRLQNTKSHVNIDVAQAIKARVALTQGNWDEAAFFANLAKRNYPLIDSACYSKGFTTEDKTEYIWISEIQQDQSDLYGNFGAYMSRNFSSTSIRACPRAIFSKLYDLISPTDVRKNLFDPTGEHLNLPNGYSLLPTFSKYPYTSQKFLAVSISDSRVSVIHARSAEMYLIEAEALAHLNQDAAAAQVLFDFVSTRDRAYVLSNKTGQELIDEILIHRRIELWGEGFRFYDLKRLNLELDRTGGNHNPSISYTMSIPAGDNRWEWLIPEQEMLDNPNMVQNEL